MEILADGSEHVLDLRELVLEVRALACCLVDGGLPVVALEKLGLEQRIVEVILDGLW